jgi:hypothetical protein
MSPLLSPLLSPRMSLHVPALCPRMSLLFGRADDGQDARSDSLRERVPGGDNLDQIGRQMRVRI